MRRLDTLVPVIRQVELANSIGVDPSYLSLVFTGRRTPPPRLLAGLRDALNGYVDDDDPPITVDEIVEWLEWRAGVKEAVLMAS